MPSPEELQEAEMIESVVHRIFSDPTFRARYQDGPEAIWEEEQLPPHVRTALQTLKPHELQERMARGESIDFSRSSFMR